jgi:gluconate transporter
MQVSGPYLLVLTLGAVAFLLVLVLGVRLHAFLALLLSSMALGLAAGMEPVKVLTSIRNGLGETLGFIAVVIALGAILGQFIQHSGGGSSLASWLLGKFGRDRARWAVLTGAFLVGLPIFFDVGFIILVPIVWNLARESGQSLLLYGMPLASALTLTHAFVPPHPAPAAAAQLLGADLGLTILYGIAISIPLVLIGGILYGGWIAARIFVPVPGMAAQPAAVPETTARRPPSPASVLFVLLLPVALIFLATIADMAAMPGKPFLAFIGHPFTALTVAAMLAMWLMGFRRGLDRDQASRLSTVSLSPLASLLLITGGGGALKQVMVDAGVGPYVGSLLATSSVSPLLVCYLIAAAIRVMQGSATVAIITAAGIVAPMIQSLPGYSPEMIVLAICAGGASLSHVNDSGFWIVNQYFGMSVPETLKSWTLMKVVTSLAGIAIILAVQAVLH